MTFKETLSLHLKAVENRDLETLVTTLPEEGENLVLILPHGAIDTSRDSFVNGHKEWFADKSWKQEFEILSTIETSEMALADVKYIYTEESGNEWPALLSLVFQKKNDKWILVHDQNTPIKDS